MYPCMSAVTVRHNRCLGAGQTHWQDLMFTGAERSLCISLVAAPIPGEQEKKGKKLLFFTVPADAQKPGTFHGEQFSHGFKTAVLHKNK